jgi:hypothetical protein
VLGLAGVMTAGDAIVGAARGAMDDAQGARENGQSASTAPARRTPKRAAAETR